MIVGAFENALFETGRTVLKPGDCVFLYTDGVTESADEAGNFFSDQRLLALLQQLTGASTEEIVGTVTNDVRRFSASTLPSDDITEMALRYVGEA
jgi:sigma-B regulation protein RsbU (phosphoserine phosphatase)